MRFKMLTFIKKIKLQDVKPNIEKNSLIKHFRENNWQNVCRNQNMQIELSGGSNFCQRWLEVSNELMIVKPLRRLAGTESHRINGRDLRSTGEQENMKYCKRYISSPGVN